LFGLVQGKTMIDVVTIKIKAGNGGDGAVSFRREKYIPKGGPDGGDGGNGGSAYLEADPNMATLMDFRSKISYAADAGERGGGKTMHGASGDDLIVKVPLGTLVYSIQDDTEKLIGDMIVPGQRLLVSRGGKGGVGNYRFRSSTNRTPRQYTPGKVTKELEIKLEVKLMADVGLVGLPNAGKSTLVNALTNANAKIGQFPFTTLSPNLGVLTLKDGSRVVIADIPGLIEGASDGKGLGDQFLRHVERTRLLVHVVDPFQFGMVISDADVSTSETADADVTECVETALGNYDTIRQELMSYGGGLADKSEIIVINKLDITEVRDAFDSIVTSFKNRDLTVFGMSAATGEGVGGLVNAITLGLAQIPKKPFTETATPITVLGIEDLPNKRMVFDKGSVREK
jgi:GTPase